MTGFGAETVRVGSVLSTVTVISAERDGVAGGVGRDRAEVVVAVGLARRVPARGLVGPDARAGRGALEDDVATPEPPSVELLTSVIVPLTSAPSTGDVIEPVGSVASTSQVYVTSVASVFPAASLARTFSVWEPSASAGAVNGVAQGAQPPPSRSHSKVAGDSVEPRPNVGVESGLGCAGVETKDVFGAVTSTVQACVAGVASRLPAASFARTSKVWAASVRPVYDTGLEQLAKAPPSRRHSKPGPASEAMNEKLGARGVRVGGRGGGNRRVRGRRVDREDEGGRACVDVPGDIRRADVERVGVLGERAERQRARRRRPRAAVQAHLERRPGLGRAEREGRRRVLGRGGRRGVERRVGGDRVDPDGLREHAGVVADPVERAVLDGRDALGGDGEARLRRRSR